MDDSEYRILGGRVDDFRRDSGESVDLFSSNEAFKKVKEGLEGCLGDLVLLIKPEVTSWYRGGDAVADHTSQIGSLGVLTGVPVSGGSLEKSHLVHGIILPVEKYVHDFSSLREGPMEFDCVYAENVGISDSDQLSTKISIYVGTRAIEDFAGAMDPIAYFKSMKLLGRGVSDEFYSDNGSTIGAGRDAFLGEVRSSIIRGLESNAFIGKRAWEDLYHSVLEWGVQDKILELDDMISVPIGKYIENKL